MIDVHTMHAHVLHTHTMRSMFYLRTNCNGQWEGVCLDPEGREAILGTGGPGPPEKGKGQQLAPDSGGEGT